MTGPNSLENDHLGNNHPQDDPQDGCQHSNPSGNDSQSNLHDNLQNDEPTINLDTPQGEASMSDFEHYFTNIRCFQESVLSNLNRLDFKHLQLAGVRTPVSQKIQQKCIIPSKCDEKLTRPGFGSTICSNTSRTVREIKACYGMHHDGWGLRGRQDHWIEPTRLFKHVRGSSSLVQRAHENDGGHFDSFNLCVRCRNRDRENRSAVESFTIGTFYSKMCQHHCLEYIEQRPYNTCRCKMFLEKYWRCHVCSLDTMDELRLRAQTFGDISYPTFKFDTASRRYVDERTGIVRRVDICPILNCGREPWFSGPVDKKMLLCRACTAIFPEFH